MSLLVLSGQTLLVIPSLKFVVWCCLTNCQFPSFPLLASGREDGTDAGLIAGIVCGTLVFILALLGVACWWRYKNWKLRGEKPFNHFIKIELRPYNSSHGTQRISRLSSCVEEKIDPDVELCPVYASITDTERLEANTYEEPPVAKTSTSTRKPSNSGMKKPPRSSVKKPTKPPPGPPVLGNGTLCLNKGIVFTK